jgi:hypothetical protein
MSFPKGHVVLMQIDMKNRKIENCNKIGGIVYETATKRSSREVDNHKQ